MDFRRHLHTPLTHLYRTVVHNSILAVFTRAAAAANNHQALTNESHPHDDDNPDDDNEEEEEDDLLSLQLEVEEIQESDIVDAINYLKNRTMTLLEVLDLYEDIEKNLDFWQAFLDNKDELPRFEIWNLRTLPFVTSFQLNDMNSQDWKVFRGLFEYDPYLYECVLLGGGDFCPQQKEYVAKTMATKFPLLFGWTCRELPLYFTEFHDFYTTHVFKRLKVHDHVCQEQFLNRYLPKSASGSTESNFWDDRDRVLAWGRDAGGAYLNDAFPAQYKDDAEVLTAFFAPAPGRTGGHNSHSNDALPEISERLQADPAFMKQAVRDWHPRWIEQIDDSLVGNMDLLLAALSSECGWTLFCLDLTKWYRRQDASNATATKYDWFSFWVRMANTVRERLVKYHTFVNVVLTAISLPPVVTAITHTEEADQDESKETSDGNPTSEAAVAPSPLRMLCQGEVTSQMYTRIIAEYIGVPVGEELLTLRAAANTLSLLGFYTWND